MKHIIKNRFWVSLGVGFLAVVDGRGVAALLAAAVVVWLYREVIGREVRRRSSRRSRQMAQVSRKEWRSVAVGAGLGTLVGAGWHHPGWLAAAAFAAVAAGSGMRRRFGSPKFGFAVMAAAGVLVFPIGWWALAAGAAILVGSRNGQRGDTAARTVETPTETAEPDTLVLPVVDGPAAAPSAQQPAVSNWQVDTAEFDAIVERFNES